MKAKNVVISVLTLLFTTGFVYAQNAVTSTSAKSENNQPATKGVYSLASAMANSGREMKAVSLGFGMKQLLKEKKVLTNNTTEVKTSSKSAKTSLSPKSNSMAEAIIMGGREMKYVNGGYYAYEKMRAKKQAAQAEKVSAKTSSVKLTDIPFSGREMKYVNAGYQAYEKMHAKKQAAQAAESAAKVTIPDMAKILVSEENNFKNVLSGVKISDNPLAFGGREGKIMALSDNLFASLAKQKAKNEQRKWAKLSSIAADAKEFIDVLLKNGKYNALSSLVMNQEGKTVKTVCDGKEYSYKNQITEQDVMYMLYSIKKNINLHAPQADSQILCNVIMNRYKGALAFNVAKSVNAQLTMAAKQGK